jgi:16S rRNA (guanine527-N7)-methyltransferase
MSAGFGEPTADSLNVSRETFARLEVIVAQVRKWQPRINLISPGTLPEIWLRHIADSLQLWTLVSNARKWVDIGSGGGFPGLVIAAMMAEFPEARTTLIESNAKKCAFLRETSRLAALPVDVICGRIEQVLPGFEGPVDVVSARALASLDQLLHMTSPLIARGATGLFPKGQDVDGEIAEASRTWLFAPDLIQSETEANARIVVVTAIQRRS